MIAAIERYQRLRAGSQRTSNSLLQVISELFQVGQIVQLVLNRFHLDAQAYLARIALAVLAHLHAVC